jgi:hypothetical protein
VFCIPFPLSFPVPSDLYGQGTSDRLTKLQVLKHLSRPVSNSPAPGIALFIHFESTVLRLYEKLYRLHFNPLASRGASFTLCSLHIIVSRRLWRRCILNLLRLPCVVYRIPASCILFWPLMSQSLYSSAHCHHSTATIPLPPFVFSVTSDAHLSSPDAHPPVSDARIPSSFGTLHITYPYLHP